jgi:hypothetical protein
MQGRRVWPDERGFLRSEEMRAPGSYGRATRDFVKLHGRQVGVLPGGMCEYQMVVHVF